jgi:hypothetical protein
VLLGVFQIFKGLVQLIRQGGAVTAAKPVQRIQSEYPEIARQERRNYFEANERERYES